MIARLGHGFRNSPVAFLPAVSLKVNSRAEAEVSTGRSAIAKFWGGFRVSLEQIEFWQGGEHRPHDRFCTSVKMMRGRLIVLHPEKMQNLALIAGTPDSGTLFYVSFTSGEKSCTGKGAVVIYMEILMASSNLIKQLQERGLVARVTDEEALAERLAQGPIARLYCGFDPTADSLHLGHLFHCYA